MTYPKGQVHQLALHSECLKDNRHQMILDRPVIVYEPCRESFKGPYPTLYGLASWLGAGRMMMDFGPFVEPLNQRLDRLIGEGRLPPCVVVCPDLYTSLGGSQYINSSYMGAHADHVVHEVIPFVEQRFDVRSGAESRGVFGISSGGFGALRFAMDFDDVFGALSCHSGDMGFELVYGRDLVTLASGLAPFKGDVRAYLRTKASDVKVSGFDKHLHMLIGMAATYSPSVSVQDGRTPAQDDVGFDLPVDWYTGMRREEVWQRWLEHDPVERIDGAACQKRLKAMKKIYIEVGFRDQYFLHFGARQLHQKLARYGVDHDYVEIDDDHSGLRYRFDASLPLLASSLS